jgi:hypothetical protein
MISARSECDSPAHPKQAEEMLEVGQFSVVEHCELKPKKSKRVSPTSQAHAGLLSYPRPIRHPSWSRP